MLRIFLICIFFTFDGINGQYVPPDATVLPLHPIGIKISIPDEEGISLVAFHVNFNQEFFALEAGTIARDIIKPRNGRWAYEDRSTKLKEGDIVYYWIHVVFEGLGYNLLDQQYTVTEFYDYNGAPIGGSSAGVFAGNVTCPKTVTKVFGSDNQTQNVCSGALIFEDTFENDNQLNQSKWNIVERFSGAPDYEFVVYRNSKKNVNVVNGNLKITPVLLEDSCGYHYVENGSLSLNKCTGAHGSRECQRKAQGFLILPPVISGRIDTKNRFSFQFGRIVIRAKMPRGDWIYPLLWLEPLDREGALSRDDVMFCFQMRVASAVGNIELRSSNQEDLSGHILRGGFLSHTVLHTTDVSNLLTNDSTKSKPSNQLWSDDFHLFEMEWRPEAIISKVDGEIFGEMKFDTPLQQSFYITLGVAVGGYSEFPDNSKSKDYEKPWNNFKSKALLNFYRKQSTWFNTWRSGTSLKVDFIKVWAL